MICHSSIREDVHAADDAGDAGSGGPFTEFSREAGKQLWFLKTHLLAHGGFTTIRPTRKGETI